VRPRGRVRPARDVTLVRVQLPHRRRPALTGSCYRAVTHPGVHRTASAVRDGLDGGRSEHLGPIATARSSMLRSPWCRSYVARPACGCRAGPSRPGSTRGTTRSPRRPRLCGRGHHPSSPRTPRRPPQQRGGPGLVDDRRDAPDVGDLGADAVRREHLVDELADQASRPPRRRRRASAGCRSLAAGRDDVLGRPGPDHPQTRLAPARGSRRRERHAGSSVTSLPRA
jgi:hypothetical protein